MSSTTEEINFRIKASDEAAAIFAKVADEAIAAAKKTTAGVQQAQVASRNGFVGSGFMAGGGGGGMPAMPGGGGMFGGNLGGAVKAAGIVYAIDKSAEYLGKLTEISDQVKRHETSWNEVGLNIVKQIPVVSKVLDLVEKIGKGLTGQSAAEAEAAKMQKQRAEYAERGAEAMAKQAEYAKAVADNLKSLSREQFLALNPGQAGNIEAKDRIEAVNTRAQEARQRAENEHRDAVNGGINIRYARDSRDARLEEIEKDRLKQIDAIGKANVAKLAGDTKAREQQIGKDIAAKIVDQDEIVQQEVSQARIKLLRDQGKEYLATLAEIEETLRQKRKQIAADLKSGLDIAGKSGLNRDTGRLYGAALTREEVAKAAAEAARNAAAGAEAQRELGARHSQGIALMRLMAPSIVGGLDMMQGGMDSYVAKLKRQASLGPLAGNELIDGGGGTGIGRALSERAAASQNGPAERAAATLKSIEQKHQQMTNDIGQIKELLNVFKAKISTSGS